MPPQNALVQQLQSSNLALSRKVQEYEARMAEMEREMQQLRRSQLQVSSAQSQMSASRNRTPDVSKVQLESSRPRTPDTATKAPSLVPQPFSFQPEAVSVSKVIYSPIRVLNASPTPTAKQSLR